MCVCSQGKGSPLDVYVQPDALRTPALLAQMGIADPGGLPDDLIYTAVNKLMLKNFRWPLQNKNC